MGKKTWHDDPYYYPLNAMGDYDESYGGATVRPEDHAAVEHGFHGSSNDLVDKDGNPTDRVMARKDRGAKKKDANYSISSPWFVNYWTPNPLAEQGRRYLDDPDISPEENDRLRDTEVIGEDAGELPKDQLRDQAEAKAWEWTGGSGRPRVYEGYADVPDRPVGLDPNWSTNPNYHNTLAMAAGGMKVTDTHWIPPGKDGKAVQGTLPHVNWNQFGAPNVGNPEDVEVGLTAHDLKLAYEREQDAEDAKNYVPPTEGQRVREQHERDVAAGQMRLPGF